jgi:hypothetical protein
MSANQRIVLPPRYTFQHGDDFTVQYIGRRDKSGKIECDLFAVTGGGYKVYFQMMRLLPRDRYEESRPRSWGFGDVTNVVTGGLLWNFNVFVRSPPAHLSALRGFKGDMVTVRGGDNRTYVECRTRDGKLRHRFLLAYLLPQWQRLATIELPVSQPDVPAFVASPQPVSEVTAVPAMPVLPRPPVSPAVVPEPVALAVAVREDLNKVKDRLNPQMLEFVVGPLAGMLRVPASLRRL